MSDYLIPNSNKQATSKQRQEQLFEYKEGRLGLGLIYRYELLLISVIL